MIEATVTFGPGTQVRVTGESPHEVLAQLTQVERSEIPVTMGRVIRASGVQESLGRNLGAELVEEHSKEEPAPAGFGEDDIPEGVQIVPGAPIIAGKPAWLISGETKGRPWTAFIHPDRNVDRNLPTTDDENDPRLAQGKAKFWRFLK